MKKLTLVLLTVLVAAMVGLLALPHLVDRLVLPALLAKTPFSFSRAQMSRITPYLVEGSVEMVEGDKPVISIPRFQLRFTPRSLLNKQISSLVLDHATLHFHSSGGRLVLPGFTPQSGASSRLNSGALFLLPLGVESVTLSQCRLVIHTPDRPALHVVVNGQLLPAFSTIDDRYRLEELHASLIFSDDFSAVLTGNATLKGDELALALALDNTMMALPDGFLTGRPPLPRFKTLSSALDLSFDASTLALNSYRLDGTIEGLDYRAEKLRVAGSTEDNIIKFSVSGDRQIHDFRITTLSVASLFNAEVDIDGRAQYHNGRLKTSGSAAVALLDSGRLKSDIAPLVLHYDGIWSEGSGATLEIRGSNDAELDLVLADGWSLAGLDDLRFSVSLDATAQQLQGSLELESGPWRLYRDFDQLASPGAHLELSLSGFQKQLYARLNATLEEVSLPGQQLRVKNIVFDLPVSSAFSDSVSQGSVTIESVVLDDEHLLGLAAEIQQQGWDYAIDGRLELFDGVDLQVPFKGLLSWPSRSGNLSWALESEALEPGMLPAFLALPADLDFSGRLEAHGELGYDRGFSARAQAAVVNGSIALQDSGIAIEDLNCGIEFPELPRLQSSPSQRCSAATIDISTLHFSDLSLAYRVENPNSLFIERSKIGWCGGTLESGSLRLSSETPELDTTFFCSRISLVELLDQLGFKGTEGEGSLNGKLPVRLSRERLEFDDGFLFSTPGSGGIVRFSDTDLLRQGVGAVSEAGFLDYTLQALEDFTYNWTKLTFNSAGDELLLTLELDGKPSSALPFAFDKRGMLIKSEKGQGLQYPIRLDVNFRVPLADLFQVGQSLNTIMGSGQ